MEQTCSHVPGSDYSMLAWCGVGMVICLKRGADDLADDTAAPSSLGTILLKLSWKRGH